MTTVTHDDLADRVMTDPFGQASARVFIFPAAASVSLILAALSVIMFFRSFETSDRASYARDAERWAARSNTGGLYLFHITFAQAPVDRSRPTGWTIGTSPPRPRMYDHPDPSVLNLVGIDRGTEGIQNVPGSLLHWLRVPWLMIAGVFLVLPVWRSIHAYGKILRARKQFATR